MAVAVRRGRTGDGARLFLLAPRVTKEGVARFLAAFAKEVAGDRVGLVRDGSGSHRADIPWPDGVAPLPLPRYSPELTPAEQIFRVLRPKLSNRIFENCGRAGGEHHRAPPALLGAARLDAAPDRLPVVDRRHLYDVTASVKEY